jgi:hypothetical protein
MISVLFSKKRCRDPSIDSINEDKTYDGVETLKINLEGIGNECKKHKVDTIDPVINGLEPVVTGSKTNAETYREIIPDSCDYTDFEKQIHRYPSFEELGVFTKVVNGVTYVKQTSYYMDRF